MIMLFGSTHRGECLEFITLQDPNHVLWFLRTPGMAQNHPSYHGEFLRLISIFDAKPCKDQKGYLQIAEAVAQRCMDSSPEVIKHEMQSAILKVARMKGLPSILTEASAQEFFKSTEVPSAFYGTKPLPPQMEEVNPATGHWLPE